MAFERLYKTLDNIALNTTNKVSRVWNEGTGFSTRALQKGLAYTGALVLAAGPFMLNADDTALYVSSAALGVVTLGFTKLMQEQVTLFQYLSKRFRPERPIEEVTERAERFSRKKCFDFGGTAMILPAAYIGGVAVRAVNDVEMAPEVAAYNSSLVLGLTLTASSVLLGRREYEDNSQIITS